MRSLTILPLNVACNVSHKRRRKQQRLYDVRSIEVPAGINLVPLRIVDVEHEVAIQSDPEEQHGQEGQLVRAEVLEGSDLVAGWKAVPYHRIAWVFGQVSLHLVLVP